ncbi:Crp/Fnr family transcriptional regulator [Methylobacterium sp. Leaf113]|uniref:Crp/Fnr family transcriptional regulator n=1 Tax=Methylobacterium sp. Leaf113 TaxID=1736259 RepID=UPI000A7C6128|nr:cyclic nucleotide-binding domain-containing protein [Methylobacterium sp. Leaf113]
MLNPFIQKLGRRFSLSGEDEKALTGASAHLRKVQSRTALILEGDVPDHVHLIQRGFACRYKVLAGGGRSIVGFLIPGDFCDLNVSILGEMDHSIGTISSCDVVRIPRLRPERVDPRRDGSQHRNDQLLRRGAYPAFGDEWPLRETSGPEPCLAVGRPRR